jgi:acetyl-CoA C-acetyltransferase
MVEACEAAAVDAGDTGLLGLADVVLTPKGTWRDGDPGRLVAGSIGNTRARTLLAELGVLQTTLFGWAARAIAGGEADVALIVGGEARWRDARAAHAVPAAPGATAPGTSSAGASSTGATSRSTDHTATAPDVHLEPQAPIISSEEIGAGLVTAVSQYAMIENARRAADGQALDEHQRAVAELWARFNQVGRANPRAWNRLPLTAEDIGRPGPGNQPLSFPYNKWHCSQWNVDQAAGIVMCAAEVARARGIPSDRWVFPHAVVESNAVVPLSRRRQPHRSPGFSVAGTRAMTLARTSPDDIAHIDLYSCFPVAVRVQAAELGIGAERQLTVTGGMTFAGGPLNNYVLQAMAEMSGVLRSDPTGLGLVTAVSGMLTKQGVSIWSCRPPAGGYRAADVSDAVGADDTSVAAFSDQPGQATVTTYTAIHARDGSVRGVVVADRADGSRAIAATADPQTAAAMMSEEWCGRVVHLDGNGGFRVV